MGRHQDILNKIKSWEEVADLCQKWKADHKSIVFTNGCFDLLHRGHVDYLAKAADLGDKLVLGLNGDDSVRRLKGEHRPIQDEHSRSEILAALECISAVVIFNEDTPLELIQTVQPDILVKGGDYTEETIVGAPLVRSIGGSVEVIPFLPGYSTSSIESKIKDAND